MQIQGQRRRDTVKRRGKEKNTTPTSSPGSTKHPLTQKVTLNLQQQPENQATPTESQAEEDDDPQTVNRLQLINPVMTKTEARKAAEQQKSYYQEATADSRAQVTSWDDILPLEEETIQVEQDQT